MLKSLIKMITAFTTKLNEDSIAAFAAQAAFFIILSFFPFFIFLLTLLQYLPFSVEEVYELLLGFFPEAIASFISSIMEELVAKASGTLLSVSVIIALWSASRGILALSQGLNEVYNHKETRNYFLLRLISTLYTLIFALLLIATLLLLVFGNQLYDLVMRLLPFLSEYALLVMSIRSLASMTILALFFLILYLFIPNRKSHFWLELPGALFTAAGWLVFSYLFSYYIDHMGNYSYTYGSLTAIAICMLWLYACMYILFIGAEINVLFSHPNIRQAGKAFLAYRKKQRAARKDAKKDSIQP